MLLATIKNTSIGINREKMRVNVNAAIDDWLDCQKHEETRVIMKRYAFKTKIITQVLMYSAGGCFLSYILVIVAINVTLVIADLKSDGKIQLRICHCIVIFISATPKKIFYILK